MADLEKQNPHKMGILQKDETLSESLMIDNKYLIHIVCLSHRCGVFFDLIDAHIILFWLNHLYQILGYRIDALFGGAFCQKDGVLDADSLSFKIFSNFGKPFRIGYIIADQIVTLFQTYSPCRL